MTAKKNIIKDLRLEIKGLKDKLKGEQQRLAYRKIQFMRLRNAHKREIDLLHARTRNVATALKYRFAKDLSWLALTDDADSKMQIVKNAIETLQIIGAPEEDISYD